jgi:hypothetical protein
MRFSQYGDPSIHPQSEIYHDLKPSQVIAFAISAHFCRVFHFPFQPNVLCIVADDTSKHFGDPARLTGMPP